MIENAPTLTSAASSASGEIIARASITPPFLRTAVA
jgi:hypothetical protein